MALDQGKDYIVKDISLAPFGRKEIELAETEMPGLMAIRAAHEAKGEHEQRHRPQVDDVLVEERPPAGERGARH